MQVVPDMEWAAQGKFVTWTERLTRSCREFMYGHACNLPPQYRRSIVPPQCSSLLGRSYAYDRGAGTVTFPEQYGVRIGKGAMPTVECRCGTVECRNGTLVPHPSTRE